MFSALSPFLVLQMPSFWEREGTEAIMRKERSICSVWLLGNKYIPLIPPCTIFQQGDCLFPCVLINGGSEGPALPSHCLTGFMQRAGLDAADLTSCPALSCNIITTSGHTMCGTSECHCQTLPLRNLEISACPVLFFLVWAFSAVFCPNLECCCSVSESCFM